MTVQKKGPGSGEPDGELALALAVREGNWPHTMDASEWARQWLSITADKPEAHRDEGYMISWFANAIMAGYDTAQMRAAQSAPSSQMTTRSDQQQPGAINETSLAPPAGSRPEGVTLPGCAECVPHDDGTVTHTAICGERGYELSLFQKPWKAVERDDAYYVEDANGCTIVGVFWPPHQPELTAECERQAWRLAEAIASLGAHSHKQRRSKP